MTAVIEAAHRSYNLPAILAIGAGAVVLIPSLLACAAAVVGVALLAF